MVKASQPRRTHIAPCSFHDLEVEVCYSSSLHTISLSEHSFILVVKMVELRGSALIAVIILASGLDFLLFGFDQGLIGGILAGKRCKYLYGLKGPFHPKHSVALT